MRTIRAAAFIESEVDRDQEIALGEEIRIWRDAVAQNTSNPRIERAGQNAAVKLAEVNQRYLPNVLRKYYGYTTIDHDELWTTGFLGLCIAARRYDPYKGYFWHFARMYVHGEIQDLLRKNYNIILSKQDYAKAQRNPELKGFLSYTPINEEILDGVSESSNEFPWSGLGDSLQAALDSLALPLREIIERVYGLGCEKVTQAVIALERGVSNTTISKHRKKAERLLREFLEQPEGAAKIRETQTAATSPAQLSEVSEQIPEAVEVVPEQIAKIEPEPLELEAQPVETVQEIVEAESPAPEPFPIKEIVSGVKKVLDIDTIERLPIGNAMECPNCHAEIPEPLEGTKVSCSKCYSRYERTSTGLEALDRETNRFEQKRIRTFNNLSRTYHELEKRGERFNRVRERILNLWRETERFRIFDESAMERVGTWIEEVEFEPNRNTA